MPDQRADIPRSSGAMFLCFTHINVQGVSSPEHGGVVMRRNWVVLALTEESVLGRNVARRRAAAILLAAIRANKQFGSAPALLDNVPTPIVGSVADELRVLIAAHGLAEAAI